jgi:hypothetical protein
LKRIEADGRGAPAGKARCPRPAPALGTTDLAPAAGIHPVGLGLASESLRALADREAVVCPDDLLLRRMDSSESLIDRPRAEEIARHLFGGSRSDSGQKQAVGNEPDCD